MSIEDVQEKIETWRHDYNHFRPHSCLNYMTPIECAVMHQNTSPNNFSNGVWNNGEFQLSKFTNHQLSLKMNTHSTSEEKRLLLCMKGFYQRNEDVT